MHRPSSLEELHASLKAKHALGDEAAALGPRYLEVPGSTEAVAVPLALTIPETMEPREVAGIAVTWSNEAMAAFHSARQEALRYNREFAHNLPFASLRSLLEVAFNDIARLAPSVGLKNREIEQDPKWRDPFLFLESTDVARAEERLRTVFDEWIVNYFAPQYAEPGKISDQSRDRLLALRDAGSLVKMTPFREALLPWGQFAETGTTRPLNPGNFRQLADYVSQCLAGREVFPGCGPMRRIVSTQSVTSGIAELITDPIPLEGKGSFSFLLRVQVVTFPGVGQPLLTLSMSKRRWLTDLKTRPGPHRVVGGFVLPRNRPDRALRFTLRYTKDRDGAWRWLPQNDYDALRLPMGLPMRTVEGAEIAAGHLNTAEHGVVLTYRDGVAAKLHEVKAGVPERDQLDAFRAVASHLEPLGLVPFGGYQQVNNPPVKRSGEVRTVNDLTMLSAVLQLRAENRSTGFAPEYFESRSDEQIDALLRKEIQRGLGAIRNWAKLMRSKDQTDVLEEVIRENQAVIEALYPGDRPHLVLFYDAQRRNDFRLLEAVVRVLWGDAVQVIAQRLPEGVHGPRDLLPGKELSAWKRAQERLQAWRPVAEQIGASNQRTFCLVMAQKDYYPVGERYLPDDGVNKAVGRQALASIGGAAVQYLLPPQESQEGVLNLTDFLHRAQAALRDLLLAHSGRIDLPASLREKFFPAEAAPREVIGISIVRQHTSFAQGNPGTTFLPVAFRLDLETGRCEMRCAYESGAGLTITPWKLLPDALCTIAGLSSLRIGRDKKERQNRFMRFCDEVISSSVQEGAQPVVLIDSSNTAQLWGWLSDRQMNPSNIWVADRERMQVNWKGARIVRVRQDLAPGVVVDKAKIYQPADSEDPKDQVRIPKTTNEKGLYRMSPTQTGCVAYLSVANNRLHSNARGLSCYRPVLMEGGAFTAYSGHSVSPKSVVLKQREPYTDQWPTPNPLEVVVALRQEGDDPDRIARFVEALRYGFGHYGQWTSLPAPLFFERVVRDYTIGYDLSDAMEAESGEDENGSDA